MRVYQASWDVSGFLVLIGITDSTLKDKELAFKSNTQDYLSTVLSDNLNTPFHPYTCSQTQIEYDINSLEFSASSYKIIEQLVPSDEQGPFVSPLLLSSRSIDNSTSLVMKKWATDAACFDPFSTAYFLTSFQSRLSEFSISLRFDQSVLFWLEMTKFILDLITRGKFIPGIIDKNKSHWHIIIHEPYDLERLEIFKKNIPAFCNGYIQTATENLVIQDLVDSFISIIGDALIKNFLKRQNLAPTINPNIVTSNKINIILEWLKNLSNPNQINTYTEEQNLEFQLLSHKLKLWGKKLLSDSQQVELITGFKLKSPEGIPNLNSTTEKIWRLEFFLTSSSDKTKYIYPEQIWSNSSEILNDLDYTPEEIENKFIKSLGNACNLFPPLKEGLMRPFPSYTMLTTAEAYFFLKEASPLLEQAGFYLQLPNWWTHPQSQVGLTLDLVDFKDHPKTKGHKSFFSVNQLIYCSWKIMAGKQVFEVEEFKQLMNSGEALVNLDGNWIELNHKQLKKTLDFIEQNKGAKQMSISEVLRLGYGLTLNESILPIINFTATGWLQALVNSTEGTYEKLAQPKSFKGELRPYQKDGMSWMYFLQSLGMGACLADDMGLGKTIQFLALLLTEKEKNYQSGPTLLIVPMSTLNNWMNEIKNFTPSLKAYLHHGQLRHLGNEFLKRIKNSDIIITTYNLVFRDKDFISSVNWGCIALDEAQNIKNLSTKQTQSIRNLVEQQLHNPERTSICQRVALTGTPMENHLEELWSIMDFLNPGYLGTISSFRSKFALPIERYQDKEIAEKLNKIISPFILRRVKTDPKIINDLPEKIELIEYIDLTREQAALYEKTLTNLFPQIDSASGIHRKGLVLSTITKLKQICDHPELGAILPEKLSLNSGKLNRLEEILETIYQVDDKVLIFTQFAKMGFLLKNYLQERFGSEVLFLHGGLSKSARDKLIDKFQSSYPQIDSPKVFILSLKAGGLGLNLTAANQVIHFDQWWNPAVENQATSRAFRIGQKRNVQVRKFICRGTLEERIAEMLKNKESLAEQIIGGSTKNIITELSTDELFGLLKLTQDPIETW
ncbi:MAG: DEAD/DEAH box helicase [Deltaproteobacteria bacterium]|jgi:SNF2 family DNA or RNA helicase|nr:DEAD/DEAH box helicase [Deltaproteobacteria bacterium]